MDNTILVAIISLVSSIITGGLALIGVIITNSKSNKEMENKLATQQAVTDTKIEELTREVRMHNDFAQRIPVIQEQIKEVNNRVNNFIKEK